MGSVATFFCNLGSNLIVWDAERDKPLCQFIEGVCQTADKRVIAKLKEQGYECVDDGGCEEGESAPSGLSSLGIADLRKLAGKAGIKAYSLLSKVELVEALEAKEAERADLGNDAGESIDDEQEDFDPLNSDPDPALESELTSQ